MRHGVSLSWLITGEGEPFDDPSQAPPPSTAIDPWAMARAWAVTERICKEIGRPATGSQIAEEASILYSALLTRIVDLRDRPMVEAALAVLAEEHKQRILNVVPGTGKRSAS
ncbi:hypothetical protein D4A92_19910 [Rhizobium rosettiformans]|uniref:XRE family transcriptional regulator n=1 Tax=Rhizobium rosettiformans TaxID=1368430 RepID=A0ABX7F1Z7_9HYPH|nr:hypothetical protein [Rhizobium rosettiformans]QRF53553.1 hypothetical protein D4A92_19910 [Rhizobium rosettiformans]